MNAFIRGFRFGMWLAVMLACFLFLVIALVALTGQPVHGGELPPPRTVPPPVIPCFCWDGSPCQCDGECLCQPLSYSEAKRLAIKQNRPLVVYVKQRVKPIPGCVVARLDDYEADAATMVVVSTQLNGELYEFKRLEGVPSINAITQAVAASRVRETRITQPPQAFAAQPVYFAPMTGRACVGGG